MFSLHWRSFNRKTSPTFVQLRSCLENLGQHKQRSFYLCCFSQDSQFHCCRYFHKKTLPMFMAQSCFYTGDSFCEKLVTLPMALIALAIWFDASQIELSPTTLTPKRIRRLLFGLARWPCLSWIVMSPAST